MYKTELIGYTPVAKKMAKKIEDIRKQNTKKYNLVCQQFLKQIQKGTFHCFLFYCSLKPPDSLVVRFRFTDEQKKSPFVI